uniref:Beta-defensin n=1 Tax=Rhinolophus ferrumequinum TaxID=59479 RepID=A0A671FU29_RHIFE
TPGSVMLPVLFFFLKIILALWIFVSGIGASERHCMNLSGICRRDICKIVEDTIGACRRRWKCCRAWWILIPVPTPLVYSDYQAPLKHKLT